MKFLEFLRDDSPWSTMRVATFVVIALFVPTFVAIWGYLSVLNHQLQVIPDSVMWLLGVVLGAKTIQKAIEVAQNIFGGAKPPTQ